MSSENLEADVVTLQNGEDCIASSLHELELNVDKKVAGLSAEEDSVSVSIPEKTESEGESEDVELGSFLFEEASAAELPAEVLERQKKEKLRELLSEKNLEKLEGIWKKVNTAESDELVLLILISRQTEHKVVAA